MKIKLNKKFSIINTPARVICLGFACTIIIGTILLMLPISSKSLETTPFITSLFTATSATCVTGLSIHDTFTHWSIFGQIIILSLIQIGGLGLVTFTTFFSVAIGRKLGLKNMQLVNESVSADDGFNASELIKMIITISIIFEVIGAIILSFIFVPEFGSSGFFIAIFTSISAYCNAGFDLFGSIPGNSSLTIFYNQPIVLYTIMGLIISGGLGFIVWYDIYNYKKTKKLMLHTKIVLIMSLVFIVVGAIIFLLLEFNNKNTIGEMSLLEKFNNSLFYSISTRTAGFNTFDISSLTEFSKVFSMFLMFIGAAPGSTGGGIKITTITVIAMTVISVIKGRQDTLIMSKKVSQATVYKSISVFSIAFIAVIISTIIIFFTNNFENHLSGIDALFEAISAFATVGLSTGVTAMSNVASKLILIFTMFLGRVGPISLALSLTIKSSKRNKHKIVPEGKIMVG